MKKILSLILLFALVLSLAACSGDDMSVLEKIKDEGKIIIGTEGTYAPFTYHDEDGKLTGFDVDIAAEVAKRLGVEAEFLETKWDGLLAGVNTGRYNMVANQVWKNDDRAETFSLSSAYMKTNAVLVVMEDANIENLDSVEGMKAGHSLTSNYAEISRDKGAEIVGIDTFTEAVENLKNSRIDYTINDKETVAYYMAQNPDVAIKAFNLDIDEANVVLVLPKEASDTLSAEINSILAEMKEDGTMDAYYIKYFKEIN